MVEIINHRKAFLDMLAWSEGTDNGRSENQKPWLWRHCRRRAIYWLLRSPPQTCHAKPKTQINRRRTLPASFLLWCLPQAVSLKDFSPKSQDAVALQQIKERGALPMIDRGDIRQANRPLQQYLGFTAGRWLWSVSSSIRLTAWLQNSKKRLLNVVREIDVWAESPRLSPLWLSGASSSACHGLLIITGDNAITYKAQRDKNARELKLANAAITDMQMRQRDAAALDANTYQKELADAKAENDACVMMLPLVVVGCRSKQSVSQCVKLPPPPAG